MKSLRQILTRFGLSLYHRVHDETREIHQGKRRWPSLLFILAGIGSIVWLAVRSGRKPSRITYPCQQFVSAQSIVFVSWVASVFLGMLSKRFRKPGKLAARSVLLLTSVFFMGVVVRTVYVFYNNYTFVPYAVGQSGSRVVWVKQDGAATGWSSSFSSRVNAGIVDSMMDTAITKLTDQSTVKAAWSQLFKTHNGGSDYQQGQTIAIKVNFNNSGQGSQINPNFQVVNAVLRQLINEVGVSASNITVYDVSRSFMSEFSSGISGRFSGVRLNPDRSVCGDAVVSSARLGCVLQNTTYLINMPILKVHGDGVKVSMSMKNHFGSSSTPNAFHGTMYTNGKTSSQIVLNKHPWIKDKTILIIGDGIYGTKSGTETSSPSGSDGITPWPDSIFLSRDPIALDSVMIDVIASQPGTKISGSTLSWVQQLYQNAAAEGLGTFDSSSSFNYSKINLIRCTNGSCGSVGPTATPGSSPTATPVHTSTPTQGATLTQAPTNTSVPTTTQKQGDANGDGKVDGVDYTIWLNNYLSTTTQGPSVGDFNRDGKVDGVDYTLWLNNYLT